MATQSPRINLTVPLLAGEPLEIPLVPGVPLYIVGANGAGKSALVQHAVSTLGAASVRRISAHRQTWMASGTIDFSPHQRRQFGEQFANEERNPIYRWRDQNPGAQLQSVLFDLTAAENAQARRISDHAYDKDWDYLSKIVDSERRVFDQLNALLTKGGLSISIANSEGEAIIAHNKSTGTSYSIAQMSDGERNAVIIAANVLTVKQGTVLLIDEPERHLHRAITEPFLSALFTERLDCPFIISTHEIALPLANPSAPVLMLYSCHWNGEQSSAWDAKILEPDTELPEDLKRAILGTRKAILFVEGTAQSLDQRLYSALFSDIAVISTGISNDVIQAVHGLRQTESSHDIKAFGLIDRDDRGKAEVRKLAGDSIYTLDAYSVESLYYCCDAFEAVARSLKESLGREPSDAWQEAKAKSLDAFQRSEVAENLASIMCQRKVQRQFQMPDKKEIKEKTRIERSVPSPYPEELARLKDLITNGELETIVAHYPIHKSSLPNSFAESLGLKHQSEYTRAVVTRVQNDPSLAETLRGRIVPLTAAIKAHLEQST